MSEVLLDCEFCDETVSAAEVPELKDRAVIHLDGHRSRLREQIPDVLGGETCRDDCDYVFPTDPEEGVGFECPDCGSDNFEAFARRYLYWRIEDGSDPTA